MSVVLRSVAGAVLIAATTLPARGAEEVLTAAPAPGAAPAATHTAPPPAEAAAFERAKAMLAHMVEALAQIRSQAEAARADRDVIRLECLNEKLRAARGLVHLSEQVVLALAPTGTGTATAAADGRAGSAPGAPDATTRLRLDQLSAAARKCTQLRAEADACIGELSGWAGGTRLEAIVEGLPAADPTASTGDVIWLERPPAASPFQ